MILTTFVASMLALQPAEQNEQPGPEAEASETQEKGQITVTGEIEKSEEEEITDRNHPDYIFCRSEPVIGSRAKRKRTCMKNREWAKVERTGNRDSRTFVSDSSATWSAENN